MKEFIVKENDAFRIRVKRQACLSPSTLYSIDITKEELNNGSITNSNTFRLFMTDSEIAIMAQGLIE